MTASLMRTPGTGDPLSPEACQRTVAIFDGRLRYDLQFAFKRMDKVKADKGYAGPVVVCAVYFSPIAGYIPSRAAIRYIVQAARHRSLAGADRGHARAGAVPRARADADRQGRARSHPIRVGADPDPGLRQWREDRSEGAHDPEKACPGLDPGWAPVFGKDHAQETRGLTLAVGAIFARVNV